MCKVCVEWEMGKLTNKEALNILGELIGESTADSKRHKHYYGVVEKILDKEVPMADADEELDQKWHEETHTEE